MTSTTSTTHFPDDTRHLLKRGVYDYMLLASTASGLLHYSVQQMAQQSHAERLGMDPMMAAMRQAFHEVAAETGTGTPDVLETLLELCVEAWFEVEWGPEKLGVQWESHEADVLRADREASDRASPEQLVAVASRTSDAFLLAQELLSELPPDIRHAELLDILAELQKNLDQMLPDSMRKSRLIECALPVEEDMGYLYPMAEGTPEGAGERRWDSGMR